MPDGLRDDQAELGHRLCLIPPTDTHTTMTRYTTTSQQLRDWSAAARRKADEIRQAQQVVLKSVRQIADDPDLRYDAKARRQSAARASLGLLGMNAISEAHAILHHGSVELGRRLMPQPAEDGGEAVRERVLLDQLLSLDETQQAAELRDDPKMRRLLVAAGTKFDRKRVAANPLVNIDELERTVMLETSPMGTAELDDARQAQRDLLRVAGRAIGSGMLSQDVELDGLVSDSAKRVGDVARRYTSLPPNWTMENDGMAHADRQVLEQRVAGIATEEPQA